MMQNPNQQENMQRSQNMPPQQNEGAHSLLEAHESVGSLIGNLEQLLLYEEHIQDQALQTISQKHRAFLSQLYNTIVDTLKTGQDPKVPTQTYQMEQNNDVVYGMQPSAPKSPSQSVNEINDERSEEHTSELQSRGHLVCRLLLEKKKKQKYRTL